jgi:hypothetical protein
LADVIVTDQAFGLPEIGSFTLYNITPPMKEREELEMLLAIWIVSHWPGDRLVDQIVGFVGLEDPFHLFNPVEASDKLAGESFGQGPFARGLCSWRSYWLC